MKRLIKSIVFLFVFIVLFYFIFKILWLDDKTISIQDFYNEPKNSLDVVYIGASETYNHFNTTLAYNLYGYKTGILAAASLPFPSVQFLIKESEKYQSPKLYAIDLSRITADYTGVTAEDIRRTTDSLKFSKNRIEAINNLLDYIDVDKSEYINHYFSFFIYHNSWKNIDKEDFIGHSEFYKGYRMIKGTTMIHSQNETPWNENTIELQEKNKQALINLIDYIKTNNLNVLFIVPIRCYNETEIGKLNESQSIIKENGLNVINFNTLEDYKIDYKNDLYDSHHLNTFASTKFTIYLAKYLKENYDLPNHKKNEIDSSWNSEYIRFKNDFKDLTNKDFDKLLEKYSS